MNKNNKLFFSIKDVEKQYNYLELLSAASSLSRIFSESTSPYLSSRSVENIFCYAFNSENLSRSDCSVDAKDGKIGIGIKTFLHNNGNTLQKIAEFNKEVNSYKGLSPFEMVKEIARLRNLRLAYTQRTYDLDTIIYHCVTRDNSKFYIFEEPMDYIDIDNICDVVDNGTSIKFADGKNEYSFHMSKSTLFKRFYTTDPQVQKEIKIIGDPFKLLMTLFTPPTRYIFQSSQEPMKSVTSDYDFVILPLYSKKAGKKFVYPKSGLNQWNADGRPRNSDEVYIQIKSSIHQVFKGFFPNRDQIFNLILPSGKILSAKVCQQNSKALMSNPNRELGRWILRDVLNLESGVVVTYEHLTELGIDSVKITKKDNSNFYIDFCGVDTYEEFEDNYLKI